MAQLQRGRCKCHVCKSLLSLQPNAATKAKRWVFWPTMPDSPSSLAKPSSVHIDKGPLQAQRDPNLGAWLGQQCSISSRSRAAKARFRARPPQSPESHAIYGQLVTWSFPEATAWLLHKATRESGARSLSWLSLCSCLDVRLKLCKGCLGCVGWAEVTGCEASA